MSARSPRVERDQGVDDEVRRIDEEETRNPVHGVGRLVIVRMILHAEVEERNAGIVKGAVVGGVGPVFDGAREVPGAVVAKEEPEPAAARGGNERRFQLRRVVRAATTRSLRSPRPTISRLISSASELSSTGG